MTVTGQTLGQRLDEEPGYVDRAVIASSENPLEPEGGLVALFGNLAPRGAILKRSAADPALFEKEGRAVVFSSLADLAARIDDPDLDVEADDILVLQNAGPRSDSGMPEAGYLPIPKKLSSKGGEGYDPHIGCAHVRYGLRTIILHVGTRGRHWWAARYCPERRPYSCVGCPKKRLELLVDQAEIDRRLSDWISPAQPSAQRRGYDRLYCDEVLQADEGCDFGLLQG